MPRLAQVRLLESGHVVPCARPQIPSAQFCGNGGAGPCGAGLVQCAVIRAFAPCLSVHRHARRGQDHGGADTGQIAQLRGCRRAGWHYRHALRCVPGLRGHRQRALCGLHRTRCRVQPQRGRDAIPAGAGGLQTGARALQGLHDRRGAHAHRPCVQRHAQDAGRAAGLPQICAGHNRPAKGAGHGALALPAVQLAPHGARDCA